MFNKTVDSILTSINKNIADLNAFAGKERDAASREYQQAEELAKSAGARNSEAARAVSVASKLSQLIA